MYGGFLFWTLFPQLGSWKDIMKCSQCLVPWVKKQICFRFSLSYKMKCMYFNAMANFTVAVAFQKFPPHPCGEESGVM